MTIWPQNPDDEILALIDREVERQNTTIQLIASENFTSPAVLRATGSVLTNKYSEGYPGKRYYGGNEVIDEVEDVARERAKTLFNAPHANVQPHAGANANMAVYLALLDPGDTVLGLRLDQGGHLTHGSPVNASGKLYRFVSYGVTPSDERIDLDQVRDAALEHHPKIIVAGATAYPRIIDPKPFREIADEVGAIFMFDAAHIAGLIAGGQHPNPMDHGADIMTLTTHKTLRGPRGGAILCTAELAEAIDKSVFPGLQGGPLDNVVAAKAIAFAEAATPEFKDYAAQIVRNASALAESLAGHGLRLVSGGTDNHLMLVDMRSFDPDVSGKKGRLALDRAGISLNENTVPDDPRPPYITSGLRIGTPAVTTQGMGEAEMATIGELIHRTLVGREDPAEVAAVRDAVLALCSKFTPYPTGTEQPRVQDYIGDYLPVIAAAALVTLLSTPLFRRLSFRVGAVQAPDDRRVHTRPTALLGGAAILTGFLSGMFVGWRSDALDAVFVASTVPIGVVLAALVIFTVGQVDDLREVSPPAKLAGTVLAASVLSIFGVSILFFRIPFAGLVVLEPNMSALLTVLWVVGMTTAINYIDGLDGLAAGIVAIAAAALLVYCERLHSVDAIGPDNAGPLIAAAVLGACLGFLPHNFHPAKIFMGDAGALLLGLLLAAITITVGGNTDIAFSGQTFFFFAPIFIPLVILGVPIVDTAFSILRRARRGTNVTVADKDHLHHRLMRLGHGHRRSVFILWTWTLLLSAIVLYPTYQTVEGELWVPMAIAAAALVLYTMFGTGVRSRREAE